MLQPKQVLTVWDAIRALPGKDRPHQVRHLFDLVVTHLEWDTGLVILTREELAERIGTTPGTVSRMMGTLERIGVIIRERVKMDGMRGPGVARYRIKGAEIARPSDFNRPGGLGTAGTGNTSEPVV